jgi:membrane protein
VTAMKRALHRRHRHRTAPARVERDRHRRTATGGARIAGDEGRDARPGPAPRHGNGTRREGDAPEDSGIPSVGRPSGATRVMDRPTGLNPHTVWAALRQAAARYKSNELTDRAAALTYYGVLSLFPALLVLVSLLSLAGGSVTEHVVDDLHRLLPSSAHDTVTSTVRNLQAKSGAGSALAVVGLLGALWTSSGYVAAFIRAADTIYGAPKGRSVWRGLLVRLGVTVELMVLACASALIVVFTGGVAQRAGDALGIGPTALKAWSIAKWPVLVLLVVVMIALLYRTTPNMWARGGRWITPGSLLAVAIWLAASGGFAAYVAHFASYDRTYGTLAGVIIFLVWLWLSNVAILLGLAFDAALVTEGDYAARPRRGLRARLRDTGTGREAARRRTR